MPELLIEFGCYGPRSKPVPGELWRASSYDPATDQRPGGSGDTPWEAIAWWVVACEATRRGLVMPALNSNETPEQCLARLPTLKPSPSGVRLSGPTDRNDSPGSTHVAASTFTPMKSAQARRARNTKTARKRR